MRDQQRKLFEEGKIIIPSLPEQKKNIEWATASVNAITGCNGPGGVRCWFCYAERIAQRFRGRNGFPEDDPFKPAWHPERLKAIYSRRKPTTWFPGSMCDWLDDGVHRNWRADCMYSMLVNPRHVFVTLTKQHWNLSKLQEDAPIGPKGKAEIPSNMFVGISVTNDQQVEGLKTLSRFRGVKKVVSFEPLMTDVSAAMGFDDVRRFSQDSIYGGLQPQSSDLADVDWIFIGGCSKQNAIGKLPAVPKFVPPRAWVLRLAALAKASGCKVFIKPNAEYPIKMQEYPPMVERVLNGIPALDRCPSCGELEPYVPNGKTGLPSITCYKCGWPPRED